MTDTKALAEQCVREAVAQHPKMSVDTIAAILTLALAQAQRETWEAAAKVCEDFDRKTWSGIEEKYCVKLDALHPDLGHNIAIVCRQQAHKVTQS